MGRAHNLCLVQQAEYGAYGRRIQVGKREDVGVDFAFEGRRSIRGWGGFLADVVMSRSPKRGERFTRGHVRDGVSQLRGIIYHGYDTFHGIVVVYDERNCDHEAIRVAILHGRDESNAFDFRVFYNFYLGLIDAFQSSSALGIILLELCTLKEEGHE